MKPSICTYSGVEFFPLHPQDWRAADVRIEDIAHALANTCRFAGHTREFYSVATHSCYVCDLVTRWGGTREAQLAALLHDAAEAYLTDIPAPLKPHLQGYAGAEQALQRFIYATFGLLPNSRHAEAIKKADAYMLRVEQYHLMPDTGWWAKDPAAAHFDLEPAPPDVAEAVFLEKFQELCHGR